jgi:hypothetical protein
MRPSTKGGAPTQRDAGGDPSNIERLPGTFAHTDSANREPVPPEFSDDSLALRLAENHVAELRCVAAWGRLLFWTGTHWKFDATTNAFDLARRRAESSGTASQPPPLKAPKTPDDPR